MKRYHQKEELLEQINRERKSVERFQLMAEALEDRAKVLAMKNDYTLGPEITSLQKKALNNRKRARQKLDVRIPKLVRALGEIQTMSLPCCDIDGSVKV